MLDSMEATNSNPSTQEYTNALQSAIEYYQSQSTVSDGSWTALQSDLGPKSPQIQLFQLGTSYKVVAHCNNTWLSRDWQSVFS
ncbi:hypothetical protein DFQ30_005247, partial [Apophysomyces sp. BC1015]